MRSLLGSTRFLCGDPLWLTRCGRQTGLYTTYHSNLILFHHPQDSINRVGSVSQIQRYGSQKAKDDQTSAKEEPSKQQPVEDVDDLEKFNNLSTYQKIKAMYRDYWYVLVPVHLVSSAFFFGGFYYAASSGLDIVAIMEALHFSESVVSTVRDSSAGFIALAYALYKIFTPVRYTVTLGGTTWAIKFLKTRGLIKPRRPVKEAKENMQNIISAMKLPEKERQKFLEDKGMPRIGKAVSNLSKTSDKKK